ncbi:MAG: hypothetical protein HZY79_03180 [Rhodoblastus sp.]|nr:MAG: hypothetical protein HZY79_03180 [Rhodoblastus sp.]
MADARAADVGAREQREVGGGGRIKATERPRRRRRNEIVVGGADKTQPTAERVEIGRRQRPAPVDAVKFGLEAPAPPLREGRARHVLAEAGDLTRHIAEQTGGDRAQQEPERGHARQRPRGVIAPVSGPRGDGDEAAHPARVAMEHQAETTQRMAQHVERPSPAARRRGGERGVLIARQPVGHRGAQAAGPPRKAAIAIVVEQNLGPRMAGEPFGEGLVIASRNGGRAVQDDCEGGLSRAQPARRKPGPVGGGQVEVDGFDHI